MTMESDALGPVASGTEQLLAAYGSTPIEPLVQQHPELDLDAAYAIQRGQVEAWQDAGGRVAGYKVGLTSRAMQRLLGVNEPDFGHIMNEAVYSEPARFPIGSFIQPKIEPELAFVLGHALDGPGIAVSDVVDAIDHMIPCMEIIDSRIRDWEISILDTVADNGSLGGVVLAAGAYSVHDRDLRLVSCNVLRNGAVAATGVSGAVLGNPLESVRWLANELGRRGVSLEPGQIVISGSFTPAVEVAAGDTFAAVFAGLGTVSCQFER